MSTTLTWFGVSVGVAGDMRCGALVDAGAPLEVLQTAADAVMPGAIRWRLEAVSRGGLHASLVIPDQLVDGDTERTWADVRALLEMSRLHPEVRQNVTTVFSHLTHAEARVHGIAVDEVCFHEIGTLDAIADVVGACAALHHLGVDDVTASTMALGSGSVATAHGQLPVPVPAVVALVDGWEIVAGGYGELATPTGAAVITALSRCHPTLPPMVLQAFGVGAGSRDIAGRPNVVRVLVGSALRQPGSGTDPSVCGEMVLETNVDDLDPRLWPGILASLLQAGAADAWLTPIVMKKGRPAHTLAVLVATDRAEAVSRLVFAETSTIRLRENPCSQARGRPIDNARGGRRSTHPREGCDRRRSGPGHAEIRRRGGDGPRQGRPTRDILEATVTAIDHAGLLPGASPPKAVGGTVACECGSAGDLCREVSGPAAIVDVDHGHAGHAGVEHRQQCGDTTERSAVSDGGRHGHDRRLH